MATALDRAKTRRVESGPAGASLVADTKGRSEDANLRPWFALVMATPAMLLVVGLLLVPLFFLARAAVGPPHGWRNFTDLFESRAALQAFYVTYRDSILVTLLALCLGGLLAWTLKVARSKVVKGTIMLLVLLPLWMSSVIKIYAFSVLLGRLGPFNSLLQASGLTSEPVRFLYTQTAVVIGMVYQMVPYATLPLFAVFSTIDIDLVNAAKTMGATRSDAWRTVVLPLSIRGVLATGILVYVLSVGFYLTPVLLGGGGTPFVASLVSDDIFQYNNQGAAAAMSIVLLLASLLIVLVAGALVGRRRLARALG